MHDQTYNLVRALAARMQKEETGKLNHATRWLRIPVVRMRYNKSHDVAYK